LHSGLMLELLGCLPPLVFLLTAWALDSLLYTIFSTIRNHSFIRYSFRSSHHLEVQVGGETMMARLLRSTIGALNTSSEMVMEANNLQCLPEPRGMSQDEYVKTAIPLGALVMLCFLQVYVFRLRRVIAAFYFPKREKKRIIYLYNEMLRRRMAFVIVQRKRIILRARRRKRARLRKKNHDTRRNSPFLKKIIRRKGFTPPFWIIIACQYVYQEIWLVLFLWLVLKCTTYGCHAVYVLMCNVWMF
uniref:Dendritic cell-specific transmembrane protein-like domain-containing protein n=1 Tax=Pseudonaja textilis TaxID=8673 RepID=A0A670YQW0_PSETE